MSRKDVWYYNPNPNPNTNPNLPPLWKFQSHFIHLLKILGPLRPPPPPPWNFQSLLSGEYLKKRFKKGFFKSLE